MSSIRFWQSRLNTIYPNDDKTPDYMMAHAYTSCADLGRILLRSERDHRRETAIIGTLSWLISIANHFDIDYETSLVRRFPSVCSYCLSRPCECDRTGRQAKHRSGRTLSENEVEQELYAKYNSIRGPNTDITWGWFVQQLAAIYPSNRALLARGGQGFVVGKMLEEGGELHRAYSSLLLGEGNKQEIEVELADLTAWVISCWDLDGTGKDLDAEFASIYVRGCFRCKSDPCTCPTYSITKSQEELVRSISAELRSLLASGIATPDVKEAVALSEQVESNPTPEAKKTLLDKVKQVIGLAQQAQTGSTAVKETIENLSSTVDMFGNWVS